MARPREFDEDDAVRAAMRTFWRTGYDATSTGDLCAATGLGRSSIYNAFASKHELFERALERYMEEKNDALAELLAGDGPVREQLRALLWQAVDPPAGEPAGCLVVNTTIELAGRDPTVAARLERDHELRRRALRSAIERGQRAGEIDAGRDPEVLAQFVIATISGLRVIARSGADRRALAATAATALAAI